MASKETPPTVSSEADTVSPGVLTEEDVERTAIDYADYIIVNSQQEVHYKTFGKLVDAIFSSSETTIGRENTKHCVSRGRISTSIGLDASKRDQYFRESIRTSHLLTKSY